MEQNFAKTLKKLARQEARLNAQKDAARQDAIDTVNDLIALFALKAEDLNFDAPAPVAIKGITLSALSPRGKVEPKYRLPDGRTWSGRGKQPVYIREALAKGAKLEDFLIAS
ncbi:MAG: H-NS histone family protein [Sutterella sp.]|nr:H-NS histone family protein [Sutterella sp.]